MQNDGSVSGTIQATLNDRLIVTITDADGRATTFTRSQFEDPATGRTAIGPGGGEVHGPGGLALRIADGALERNATFSIASLDESAFPIKPDLADAHFGGGLKLVSSEQPSFRKEAHLVFPLPNDVGTQAQALGLTPADAFYYVYRRIAGPNGQTLYETIDYAQVEGDGDNAKVVTASCPFSGVANTYALFDGGLVTTAVQTDYVLLWTIKQQAPGQPTTGTITGFVLQPVWDPGASTPRYVGVSGVPVWGVDSSNVPLELQQGGTIAITQSDGRYTLFDQRFLQGTVQVFTNGAQATVYALEHDVDINDPCIVRAMQKFPNVATANLTIPAVQAPAPPPALTIRVFKTVDGQRVDTRGLAIAGTPLTIGVDAGTATVSTVTIVPAESVDDKDAVPYSVQTDPLWQHQPRDPLAMPVITSELFTPPHSGSFRVKATTLPASGSSVSATVTIRVLAGAGGVDNDPNAPPSVITAQTVPTADAVGVPVTILPQVAFTEPVRQIPNHVLLYDAQGAVVPIKISAVGIDPQGQTITVDNVADNATVVTSLTIQPLLGLAYNTRYRLVLTTGITDLDKAPDGSSAAKSLLAYETAFTTFGPESVGTSEQGFSSPGLVVLGDRAYVLETQYAGGVGGVQTGALHVFNISDPVQPQEMGDPTPIGAAPRDIAGEDHTVVVTTTPHTLFTAGAAATSPDIASGPGNLLVYDVSTDTPQWIGAASLTDNIVDGAPTRVVLKDSVAYVATTRKGLQVVDLTQTALGDLATAPDWEQSRRLYAPSAGVNRQAVVATIPLVDPAHPTLSAWVNDLKVGDFTVAGVRHRLVLATGSPQAIDLAIADPVSSQIVWQGPLSTSGNTLKTPDGTLASGQAISLAQINNRDLAIVGGYGTVGGAGSSGVVAIVDLSPLAANAQGVPQVIAWFALEHTVGDILVMDSTVIVSAPTGAADDTNGIATMISLAEPTLPVKAGSFKDVGARLARDKNGVLLSEDRSLLANAAGRDALRSTAFQPTVLITAVTPEPLDVHLGRNTEPLQVSVRVIPSGYAVQTAELEMRQSDTLLRTVPIQFSPDGLATLPQDMPFNADLQYGIRALINRDDRDTRLVSAVHLLQAATTGFQGTASVDDNGRLDVLKPFNGQPVVVIDDFVEHTNGGVSTIDVAGTIRDAVAPVGRVLVGGNEAVITQMPGSDPYQARFSGQVTFRGPLDLYVTVTAINALGNTGWASRWVRRNPTLDGGPGAEVPFTMSSIPDALPDASNNGFRIEVHNAGALSSAIRARIQTDTEEKTIWLRRSGPTVFASDLLLPVPETYNTPTGAAADIQANLDAHRVRMPIGTAARAIYGDSVAPAIAAGMQIVDENGQPLRFVPGRIATPIVQIQTFDVNAQNRSVHLTGQVVDPVARLDNTATVTVHVADTLLGQTADDSGSVLTAGGDGTFTFDATVALPLPTTHLVVRAENATGAIGLAGRIVTLDQPGGPNPGSADIQDDGLVPPSLAATQARVKIFGPKTGADSLTATMSGVHSQDVGALPEPAFTFTEDVNAPHAPGIHVFVSRESVLPALIPGQALATPNTPDTLTGTRLLPVEVGGLVNVSATLGSLGALTSTTEVSGVEIVSPREASIVNAQTLILSDNSGFGLPVTFKWHGLGSQVQFVETAPNLMRDDESPYQSDLSAGMAALKRESISASAVFSAEPEELLLNVTGQDTQGQNFGTEVGLFTFTPDTAAQPTPFARSTGEWVRFQDAEGVQISDGVFLKPDVIDALDVLYPANWSDRMISEHLQVNGLRAMSVKRNAGTLVAVSRIDGTTVFEPLKVTVDPGLVVNGAPPPPMDDQVMDGDEVVWRDIVEANLDRDWQLSYTYPASFGVQKRSDIIQQVRRIKGLPGSDGGVTREYKDFAARAEASFWGDIKQAFKDFLGFFLTGPAGAAFAVYSVGDGVYQIATSNDDGSNIAVVAIPAAVVIQPSTQAQVTYRTIEATSPRYQVLVAAYRRAQFAKGRAALLSAQRTAATSAMIETSAQLGLAAADEFARMHLNISGTPICCNGPILGGGATGKFDLVYEVGGKFVIIEAKGGQRWVNVKNLVGRMFGSQYALQGSREYIQSVINAMATSTDAKVAEAGLKMQSALARQGFTVFEHYIVTAKWQGIVKLRSGRGLIRNVSPVIRVVKSFL